MIDTWRLIIDEPADGATNMARDEALLATHAEGTTPPTLRLYRWRPACLSLGRFQRASAVDRSACARASVAIVRRPSGGRALLHDDELTYAIVARADHPLLGGESILAIYQRISLALLAGLRRLGVEAELTPVTKDQRRKTKDQSVSIDVHSLKPENDSHLSSVLGPSSLGSAACFDTPAAFELTVAGRKLVGSAQTRHAGSVLQHGAIPLAPHAARLAELLLQPPDDLGTRMITLNQALGRSVGFDEIAQALIAGFREQWGVPFEHGELSNCEQYEEQRLLAAKYADDRWTYGR
ncbi:MAG TPA: biotin/lipoate A/B protein ligase family protein [Roseiflexaceae bacterium]|nr:biotin/lipoate A/B protein ligase family protein [Roseiflexaceae bacterium]